MRVYKLASIDSIMLHFDGCEMAAREEEWMDGGMIKMMEGYEWS